jgi:hypothetical protein
MGRRNRRVKKCVHKKMYINAKMIPAETILGIAGVRIKENSRGGEFKYDIFDAL